MVEIDAFTINYGEDRAKISISAHLLYGLALPQAGEAVPRPQELLDFLRLREALGEVILRLSRGDVGHGRIIERPVLIGPHYDAQHTPARAA